MRKLAIVLICLSLFAVPCFAEDAAETEPGFETIFCPPDPNKFKLFCEGNKRLGVNPNQVSAFREINNRSTLLFLVGTERLRIVNRGFDEVWDILNNKRWCNK